MTEFLDRHYNVPFEKRSPIYLVDTLEFYKELVMHEGF